MRGFADVISDQMSQDVREMNFGVVYYYSKVHKKIIYWLVSPG